MKLLSLCCVMSFLYVKFLYVNPLSSKLFKFNIYLTGKINVKYMQQFSDLAFDDTFFFSTEKLNKLKSQA